MDAPKTYSTYEGKLGTLTLNEKKLFWVCWKILKHAVRKPHMLLPGGFQNRMLHRHCKNGVELFFSPIKRCQNKHPVLQLFPLLWRRGRTRTDSTFGRQMSYVEEEGGVYEAWYKLYTKWRSPFTTSHWALWVSKWATVGESWMGLMFRHRHS